MITNRKIEEFPGRCLIVGGGWSKEHSISKPPVRTKENFYTIDSSSDSEADLIFDFSHELPLHSLPEKHFDFIFFEHLPFFDDEVTLKFFMNAKRLLSDDGVLIYRGGCPSIREPGISAMLHQAGFQFTLQKEIIRKNVLDVNNNGSLTFASNQDIEIIKQNSKNYPDVIKHYLNFYHIFNNTPFNSTPHFIPSIYETKYYANDFPNFSLWGKKINSTQLVADENILSYKNFLK